MNMVSEGSSSVKSGELFGVADRDVILVGFIPMWNIRSVLRYVMPSNAIKIY